MIKHLNILHCIPTILDDTSPRCISANSSDMRATHERRRHDDGAHCTRHTAGAPDDGQSWAVVRGKGTVTGAVFADRAWS